MKIYTSNAPHPPIEELPCTAAVGYKQGQGLVISSGAAVLATGTTAPTHICTAEKTGKAGETVPAYRITKDLTLEAHLAVAGSALAVGNKVTVDTDAINVTATTSGGVAEIVAFPEGKAAGDRVLIKF